MSITFDKIEIEIYTRKKKTYFNHGESPATSAIVTPPAGYSPTIPQSVALVFAKGTTIT